MARDKKTIEVEFYVSTRYVGTEVKETMTFEVDADYNDEDIDKFLKEEFEIWLFENIDNGWIIKRFWI